MRQPHPARRVLAALDTTSHIQREALRGLRRVEEVAGWSVTCVRGSTAAVVDSLNDPRAAKPAFDGLIAGSEVEPGELAELVAAEAMPPVIGFNRDTIADGWPCVLPDDEAVGRVAAEHFLNRGVRSFSVVEVRQHQWAVDRLDGFVERVVASGERRPVLLPYHETITGGLHKMAAWLASLPEPPSGPIGIFAVCDGWGESVLNACGQGRLAVPERIAVVSADDDPRGQVTRPPLSSIPLRWADAGARAARMLETLMDGRPLPARVERVSPGEVVVRTSSDVLGLSNPTVAAALRLMHASFHEGVRIGDIARHVEVPRRNLERAFRAAIGRTPKQELTRIRIEHAKRMLVESDVPLADIAADSGYGNATRLGIAFKAATGTTPIAFRKRHRES